MRTQHQHLKNTAQTLFAPVKTAAIAVSLVFASQFATADGLVAAPAESMSFQPAATTSQTLPANATASDVLNSTTAKPYQSPAMGQTPGLTPGKALIWQQPKTNAANAKKDDSQNQMMQQLGQLLGGGGMSSGSSKAKAKGDPYADNSKTEGGFCYECNYGSHNGTASGLDMNKVSGYVNADSIKEMGEKEKCYAKYLEGALPDALRATPFASRTRSGGKCALGVRMLLSNAGMSKKGQGLGDAINYAGRKDAGVSNRDDSTLKQIGFRKLEGFTAQNAPAGAVLVYGGPQSEKYLAGKVGNDGTGTTLGHVTIKGREGFYTDGLTTNPAGANRHLIGVYVMSSCTNCDPKVKARCEGAGGA